MFDDYHFLFILMINIGFSFYKGIEKLGHFFLYFLFYFLKLQTNSPNASSHKFENK
jgi:hypothetical protein